ncbi:MAG: transposase [Arenimonas sp.]
MARLPRFDIVGVPQHVVQRGNDRLPCFAAEIDYIRYLQDLRDVARENACVIHAYVLMTNHVHLLLTPQKVGATSRMMQALGRRYVGYFNRQYHRTGTLWEGRYKSSLVDTETYLLRCYRYIELNPVRARMVNSPDAYKWSSYAFNACGEINLMLSPHPCYLELGVSDDARQSAYKAFVSEALDPAETGEIRSYLQQGRVLGSPRFQAHIEKLHGRIATTRPRGRPASASAAIIK